MNMQITGRTLELLYCMGGQQPKPSKLDFWHTLSDCLTTLEIEVDSVLSHTQLQTQHLKQLRVLTALTFSVKESSGAMETWEGDLLDLPELRMLHVKGYVDRYLELACP